MSQEIFVDIGIAIGLFFANPLFWLSILVAIGIGYFRVKKERRSFNIRMQPGLTELKNLVSETWGYAIILSLLISGVGLLVNESYLIVFSIVSMVLLITFNFKLLSPIYVAILSVTILSLLAGFQPDFVVKNISFGTFDKFGTLMVTTTVITGLLVIIEGSLIKRYGEKGISSFLIRTKRGLEAGVFKSKKLWLMPTVFLIPGEMVQSFAPYWPQFTLGETSFTFIVFPIIIGFSQVIRTTYPDQLLPQMGRAIIVIGVVVTAAGVAALWMPILAWAGLAAGGLARIVLSIVTSMRERKTRYILAPQSRGIVIAGVVPDSPGEKLGLLPGETIRSVNGRPVHDEKELYDAIQINAAHCRLQIIDRYEEVRLLQQVLYHHDHHRLGILVVR